MLSCTREKGIPQKEQDHYALRATAAANPWCPEAHAVVLDRGYADFSEVRRGEDRRTLFHALE